ncbi:MAG: competence/damage-inducible protein A [Bdellovibrionaceae bacterium]|nr:competence/damage-inducible protein A [Pseudobdellovibrionaceae bacterium]MDW8190411.1 competence/damage-inducible protein A [Pseudobdellovibrionaceae bacterium]
MSTFSHVAIGTEIILGQIVNTNSHWLSNEAQKLGLICRLQLACPDERSIMKETLTFAAQHSHIIFVTGGLGPTSDDFTREIISEVTQRPLVWSESAWNNLANYLTTRGQPLRESHRQECYIPEAATLFLNPIGTASGFALETSQNIWICLPGPPREIQVMWPHIQKYLETTVRQLKKMGYLSFLVFGLTESAVAELIEHELKSCLLTKGYRIHIPYIEFKLVFEESERSIAQDYMNKAQQRLKQKSIVIQNLDEVEENILQRYQSSLNSRIVFLNQTKHPLFTSIFRQRIKMIEWHNLSFEEIRPQPNTLYLSWLLNGVDGSNNNYELFINNHQSHDIIRVTSPLSQFHSLERKIKDLIERALLKLAGFDVMA